MIDSFGRTLDYLRVSVTDRCNLRCVYCMPPEGVPLAPRAAILRFEEIEAVIAAAAGEGVHRVRLTGGEPLVRRGILEFVRRLAASGRIEDLSLTSNGLLLPEMAAGLRAAGLARVNLGIPSLDAAAYARLTGGGALAGALAGLEAALAAGFAPVKVNVVLLAGVNDDPRPWLELTRRLPVEVRFIEYMPIGPVETRRYFLPAAVFRRHLAAAAGGALEPAPAGLAAGPAREVLRLAGAPGRLAIIAAVTGHQCAGCNRLRLTADGKLRLCLLGPAEIDLTPALRPRIDREALAAGLRAAAAAKPECLPPEARDFGRRMVQIGG